MKIKISNPKFFANSDIAIPVESIFIIIQYWENDKLYLDEITLKIAVNLVFNDIKWSDNIMVVYYNYSGLITIDIIAYNDLNIY